MIETPEPDDRDEPSPPPIPPAGLSADDLGSEQRTGLRLIGHILLGCASLVVFGFALAATPIGPFPLFLLGFISPLYFVPAAAFESNRGRKKLCTQLLIAMGVLALLNGLACGALLASF